MRKPPAFTLFLSMTLAIGLGAQTPSGNERVVKIAPDPAFGQGVAWDSIFKNGIDTALAFLPDGSFYLGCGREGRVHKFDSSGKSIATVGRKGQGPGDLQGIAGLCLLDGAKLAIHEGMRLSLFDAQGIFLKSFPLSGMHFGMAPLANGRIALNRDVSEKSDPKWSKGRNEVVLLNTADGREETIASFNYAIPRGEFSIRIVSFEPYARMAADGRGGIVLGVPTAPEIQIFSPKGIKQASFGLGLEPAKFTWDILAIVMDLDRNEEARKFMESKKSMIALPEYLPYFLSIAVDAEGRIIVTENHWAAKSREAAFRVYSREGKLLSRIRFESGAYEPVKPFAFHGGFAYGWLAEKDGDGTFVLGRWKY